MSTAAMTPAPAPPQLDPWSLFRDYGGLTLLVPVAGWLAAQWRGWRKSREKRAELLEAMAEGVSLAADMERFRFEYTPGMRDFEDHLDGSALEHWRERGGVGLTPREQWEKLKDRTRESRERVWLARGFPEAPADPAARAWHASHVETLRHYKQTLRWKAQDGPPPPPPPKQQPEGDA